MQRYGSIIVVGGGCYGAYYVRQLGRGWAAGALAYDRLLVVDRDSACRVAEMLHATSADGAPRAELVCRDWTAFFDAYLGAGDGPGPDDAIVPSPLMPHLMSEWLVRRARARWPHRRVATRALPHAPPVPWHRAAPDGTAYVSFADWTCPVNCVEPATCPHTRAPRTWSLPQTVRAYADAERGRGVPMVGPVIFHCSHRAYGVGMFDTRDVVAADRLVAEAGARGAATVLVGTVSHCHGALNLLEIA